MVAVASLRLEGDSSAEQELGLELRWCGEGKVEAECVRLGDGDQVGRGVVSVVVWWEEDRYRCWFHHEKHP